MNGLEGKFLRLYKKIGLGSSDTCKQCQKKNPDLSSPISIWQKGKNFDKTGYRLMFVGKTARGNPKEGSTWKPVDDTYLDATLAAKDMWDQFSVKGSAYWMYTRQISDKIFGEDLGWESIAFTNIVKCNISRTTDATNNLLKTNCIDRMKVIKEEISLISPLHIVFYTGQSYDNYILRIFDSIADSQKSFKQIGGKKMSWWVFNGVIGDKSIHVLRIGHPERMKKEPYINSVVDWVLSSK